MMIIYYAILSFEVQIFFMDISGQVLNYRLIYIKDTTEFIKSVIGYANQTPFNPKNRGKIKSNGTKIKI